MRTSLLPKYITWNQLLLSLVQTLLSRNFWLNNVWVNVRNFHTAAAYTPLPHSHCNSLKYLYEERNRPFVKFEKNESEIVHKFYQQQVKTILWFQERQCSFTIKLIWRNKSQVKQKYWFSIKLHCSLMSQKNFQMSNFMIFPHYNVFTIEALY